MVYEMYEIRDVLFGGSSDGRGLGALLIDALSLFTFMVQHSNQPVNNASKGFDVAIARRRPRKMPYFPFLPSCRSLPPSTTVPPWCTQDTSSSVC